MIIEVEVIWNVTELVFLFFSFLERFFPFFSCREGALDSDTGSGLTTFRISVVEVTSHTEVSFTFTAGFGGLQSSSFQKVEDCPALNLVKSKWTVTVLPLSLALSPGGNSSSRIR